jgi:hypothetical protein
MMMAHDSSPTPSPLAEETIASVRGALLEYLHASHPGESLRGALRTMAREARTKSVLPEQLLIILKDIWYSLPTVRELNQPTEQVRLLQRVVTMCIREYYDD